MSVAEFEPGLWDVPSITAYHADRSAVSHSSLEVFRKSVPLYHALYVTGTTQFDPPTPSMVLGSALHCLLFEPEQFERCFAVAPEGIDRRTKAGKTMWSGFEAASVGKTLLTGEQHAKARMMAESARENPLVANLLDAPGKSEVSVRWRHESDVLCKARFDRLLDHGYAIDLKSAADPGCDEWSRAAHRLGYHRQAALYIEGYAVALARRLKGFLHLVVGSEFPFDTILYELDIDALDLGRRQNNAALEQLAECRQSGNWAGRLAGKINSLSLPRWAYTQEVSS